MATTTLTGTTGNDILNAPGSVTSNVAGGLGNDTITLVLRDDVAEGGAGADSITLSDASAANTVSGGTGNDSLYLATAVLNIGGSLGLNEGDDFLNFTGAQVLAGSIGGNAGNDSITLQGGILNSTVGGGSGADTIAITAGNTTNSQIIGGSGADTLNLATTLSLVTVQAADGHDKISMTANAADAANAIIAAGRGLDSITLNNTLVGTVAGGGQTDTINFVTAVGGGTIFGDGISVTDAGAGDYITLSAATAVTNGATIIGAGGADTIRLVAGVDAASALKITGDAGADLIGVTGASLSGAGTGQIIDGGAGNDTIKLQAYVAAANNLTVLGGEGSDSIWLGNNTTANANFSVVGGAGHDTISTNYTSASGIGEGQMYTIVGGAGNDQVILNYTTLGATGVTAGAAGLAGSAGGFLANLAFSASQISGDSVVVNFTGITAGAVNWNAGVPQLFVLTATPDSTGISVGGTAAGQFTANGSVFVYDAGDDLVIGWKQASSEFLAIRVQDGDELLKTTETGAQAMTASNFGFTLSSTGGNMTITFS